MIFEYADKYISGVLTILPKNSVNFKDELANYAFSEKQSLKLASIMGLDKRRVAIPGTCSSDLCLAGLLYLIDKKLLDRDEIDALLFVSQTPDYQMPPTSNLLHGKLGLSSNVVCLDINQGCAGFIVGLIQAFQLLDQKKVNQVVLLNVDVLSPKVSPDDRNSAPLIGDAASITIIKKNNGLNAAIIASLKMDGKGAMALNIPAGLARMPYSPETEVMYRDDSGNSRSLNHLVMHGDQVFNFVMNSVPPLVREILEESGETIDSIDKFIFHQPNKFMLEKLADELSIEYAKLPSNTVGLYGNSSGATIPVTLVHNFSKQLLSETMKICFCGFGVGLAWGATILNVGKLDFCEMLEV
ncbi:3-oxoacyl-ACP synthase III family protein [Polynucleobacter sp. AP-Sving-400A-A2]|uniref:3-oxoacyl-ACP synthase III family protein n=1 Tax=Polynucleobacter sp. AP-Sving-400A-A2 TaxID=2081049 RepID=UPI001BFEA705|nr:ketoacyl-ACP synthase III [Polynucleobacter sp. AP-Sving-400A-A2]QWE14853.1 ketoacyl-ACP synthase III [Polynucleobacter sp. AP-Sving-400A-A2]